MFRTGNTQTHGFANADFYYARSTKDGIVFLRKTEKGFNAMRYSDGKETTLKEFEGAFGTDYLLSGDVLIGKNGIVYNLATQKEQAFDAPGIKALAAAAVGPDGKRIVLAGEPESGAVNEQRVVYVDLEAGKQKAFTGANLYRLKRRSCILSGMIRYSITEKARRKTRPASFAPLNGQRHSNKSLPSNNKIKTCQCGSSALARFFSIQLKLPGIKLIIFPLLGNQLIMTSSLDDFAVFQHHDRIRIAHG